MEINENLDIVKSGESVVRVLLRRTSKGLTVNVRAHYAVEEFFRGVADGAQVDARVAGRYWRTPLDTEEKTFPLLAYDRKNFVDHLQFDGGIALFERLGQPLIEPRVGRAGRNEEAINLSFLRLCGVSEPEGVTFILRGVYSTEAVRRLKEQIAEGVKAFYAAYLKPVEMSVMAVTQEVSLVGLTEIK